MLTSWKEREGGRYIVPTFIYLLVGQIKYLSILKKPKWLLLNIKDKFRFKEVNQNKFYQDTIKLWEIVHLPNYVMLRETYTR